MAKDPTVQAAEIAARAAERSAFTSFKAGIGVALVGLAGTVTTAVFVFAGQADDKPSTALTCTINPTDTAKALSDYNKLEQQGAITPEMSRNLKQDAIDDQLADVTTDRC